MRPCPQLFFPALFHPAQQDLLPPLHHSQKMVHGQQFPPGVCRGPKERDLLLPKCPCVCPCVLCVSLLSVQSKSDFPWFFVKALPNLTHILPKIPPSPCQNPNFKLCKTTPGHPFYSKTAEQELYFKGHVLKTPQFIYCCGSLAFSWHPTLHQLRPWKNLDMVWLFRHLKQIKFSSQRIKIPSLFSCRINELHKTRISFVLIKGSPGGAGSSWL